MYGLNRLYCQSSIGLPLNINVQFAGRFISGLIAPVNHHAIICSNAAGRQVGVVAGRSRKPVCGSFFVQVQVQVHMQVLVRLVVPVALPLLVG